MKLRLENDALYKNNQLSLFLFFVFCISAFSGFSQLNTVSTALTPKQEEWITRNLSADEINWLNEQNTVRVRLSDNPPMYFFDREAQGISVDFLKLVTEKTGITFDYIQSTKPWSAVLEDFKTNERIDLLPSLKITEDRKPYIEFTNEYIEIPLVIFTKDNADFISSIKDLEGKKIVVEKGFWIESQLKEEFPGFDLITKKTSSEAIEACQMLSFLYKLS